MVKQERGFTYLGMLLAIGLIGIGLTAASEVWVTAARRERTAQLEWVKQQYVQAIGSYYEASLGGVKHYPSSLTDLLEDSRYLTVRRHLRRLYVNPFSGAADWQLIAAPKGGICGIRPNLTSNQDDRRITNDAVYVPRSLPSTLKKWSGG